MKSLEGYKGKIPADNAWKEQCHGMAFVVSFDNRKGDDCIGSGSIGILFEDGEELVVSNSRGEFPEYAIPAEYL